MTTLVLDASATVDLLLRNEQGQAVRRRIVDADLWSAAHLDAEVFSALARLNRAGELGAAEVEVRLALLSQLDLERVPVTGPLLSRAWALRANVAARDALYVALAEALGAPLLTTDTRRARAAPGAAKRPR